MTVQKLIDTLQKEVKKCDREIAEIEIWEDEQEYEIAEMSGFSLQPTIIFHIKKITSPICKPVTFKAEHQEMVDNKMKEIIEAEEKNEL